MPNEATIDGAKRLKERTQKIAKMAANEIEQALLNGALGVERDYKLNVSQDGLVDTGQWINSITHKTDDFGTDHPSVQVGATVTDPPYPKFHEFGTSKFPGKYPLTRAFNADKKAILKQIAKAFKKGTGL